MDALEIVATWEALGRREAAGGHAVFVADVGPDEAGASPEGGVPPLLVLHGFPTSSIDYWAVLPTLCRRRRVVLPDLPGYGLSEKPDQQYSLFRQADVVEAVVASRGLERVDLLTHDMGDSVGGELLARSLDGTLPFAIERRVLTNGSIYIDMAQLTDGQQMLLGMPDERMADDLGFDPPAVAAALQGTLSGAAPSGGEHLLAAAELVVRDEGVRILPRTIRYVEERREHEGRWTSAIEHHPAPLHVVWGLDDPVAVPAMVDELTRRRPDASVVRLEGVGHYPMIEAPDRFAEAVLAGLS